MLKLFKKVNIIGDLFNLKKVSAVEDIKQTRWSYISKDTVVLSEITDDEWNIIQAIFKKFADNYSVNPGGKHVFLKSKKELIDNGISYNIVENTMTIVYYISGMSPFGEFSVIPNKYTFDVTYEDVLLDFKI